MFVVSSRKSDPHAVRGEPAQSGREAGAHPHADGGATVLLHHLPLSHSALPQPVLPGAALRQSQGLLHCTI